MKQTSLDILKAVGLTAGGFLAGFVISKGIIWVAKATGINVLGIMALVVFAAITYANYQIVKK